MKKIIISIILVVAIVAALGITAFAAGSVTPTPVAPAADTTKAVPTVTEQDDDIVVTEKTEAVTEAYAKLDDVKPEGASVRYLFDVSSKSGKTAEDWSMTVKMANVDGKTVTAALWNGTEWVELEVVDNGDGTFTIKGGEFGAVAVFVK